MKHDTRHQRAGLRVEEIYEGVVAYFDSAVLNEHPDVTKPPSPAPRSGPFLCIEADEERSCWIKLTSKPGRFRQEIPVDARKGGTKRWRTCSQFVNDPRSTYVGSHAAFQAASVGDKTELEGDRPSVDLSIVAAILRVVDARGGSRLTTTEERAAKSAAPAKNRGGLTCNLGVQLRKVG